MAQERLRLRAAALVSLLVTLTSSTILRQTMGLPQRNCERWVSCHEQYQAAALQASPSFSYQRCNVSSCGVYGDDFYLLNLNERFFLLNNVSSNVEARLVPGCECACHSAAQLERLGFFSTLNGPGVAPWQYLCSSCHPDQANDLSCQPGVCVGSFLCE